MEGHSPTPSTRPKPNRRTSRYFSEVVSQGPTAIPADDDLSAAISSVLAAGQPNLGQGMGQTVQDQRQEKCRSHRATENASVGSAEVGNAKDSTGSKTPSNQAVPKIPPDVVPAIATDKGGGGGWGLLNCALFPLWGTIDVLRWAGGAVNEVAVAPIIRVVNPWGLVGSILTTVKGFTPQRARDLARIAGNGVLNAVGLVRTPEGDALLRTGRRAVRSLSVAVSSPAGRQLLVDSATGFVKLAEALDTPETKHAIQQGAVVVARAMDTLASRHSKIFIKDLADVMVRFVELVNSREATIMAGEVTANLLHALEMEHLVGLDRTANGVPGKDGDSLSTVGDSVRTGQPEPGAKYIDGAIPRIHGDGGPERSPGVVGMGIESLEFVERSNKEGRSKKLALESLSERAQYERSAPEEAASTDKRKHGNQCTPDSDSNTIGFTGVVGNRKGSGEGIKRGETSGRLFDIRVRGTDVTAAELLRRHTRINPTPIRQEDLTGKMPLRKLRDNRAAAAPGAAHGDKGKVVYRRTTVATRTSNFDAAPGAVCSAPLSPRSMISSCSIAAAAETEAKAAEAVPDAAASALGGTDSDARAFGRRMSSEIDDARVSRVTGTGDVSETAARVPKIDVSRSLVGEVGGATNLRSGLEHVRDGRAFLPRLSGNGFASLLRGQPLGLEKQLEAPSDGSLDHTLARAARTPLSRWIPIHPKKRTSEEDSAAAGERKQEVLDAREEAEDKNASGQELIADSRLEAAPLLTPLAKAAQGWKQLLFALLLLSFAADGVRHRWNSLHGGGHEARGGSPTQPPTFHAGASNASDDRVSDKRLKNRFRATFLPPSCQDPVSGVSMAIWVTPSGPCLSPLDDGRESTRGAKGNSGDNAGRSEPLCATSFLLCRTDEAWHGQPDDDLEVFRPSCRDINESRSGSSDASVDDITPED